MVHFGGCQIIIWWKSYIKCITSLIYIYSSEDQNWRCSIFNMMFCDLNPILTKTILEYNYNSNRHNHMGSGFQKLLSQNMDILKWLYFSKYMCFKSSTG